MRTVTLKAEPLRIPVSEVKVGDVIYRRLHGARYYRARVETVKRIVSTCPALLNVELIQLSYAPEGSNVLARAGFPINYQMPIPAKG